MSKLDELIQNLCPNGVEWKTLDCFANVITKQTGFDYSREIKPSLLSSCQEDTYPYLQTRNFSGKNFNYNTEFYENFETY